MNTEQKPTMEELSKRLDAIAPGEKPEQSAPAEAPKPEEKPIEVKPTEPTEAPAIVEVKPEGAHEVLPATVEGLPPRRRIVKKATPKRQEKVMKKKAKKAAPKKRTKKAGRPSTGRTAVINMHIKPGIKRSLLAAAKRKEVTITELVEKILTKAL